MLIVVPKGWYFNERSWQVGWKTCRFSYKLFPSLVPAGKVMPEKEWLRHTWYLRRFKTVVFVHLCNTWTFSEDPVGAVQPASGGWAVDESGGLLFAGMVVCEGHPHLGLPAAQQLPASLLQESGSALPPRTQESHFDARQTWELAKKVSSCLIIGKRMFYFTDARHSWERSPVLLNFILLLVSMRHLNQACYKPHIC